MNKRIRKFMDFQGLSPSELADTIGVQRSNVTHVLNGRNNPSFPFIEKLLKNYPKLNAKWLLMGDGEMLEGKPVFPSNLFDQGADNSLKAMVSDKKREELQEEDAIQYATDGRKAESNPARLKASQENELPLLTNVNPEGKAIEHVMIFYTDQTFRIYHPSK